MKINSTNAYPNWPNVEAMDQLVEHALNLRWCWNHASDWIWKSLDAELWESTQNPWILLLTVSRDKIASLPANPAFRKVLQDCLAHNQTPYPCHPERNAAQGSAVFTE
jgi:glycogen phosphorylase